MYNGQEYTGRDRKTAGNQFFLSEEFKEGSVTFEGHNYEDLLLNYDAFNDQLCMAEQVLPKTLPQ